jgi:hypothetical protein
LLAAYLQAQAVNHAAGGMVIKPWEIARGDLPDEWIDAAYGLASLTNRLAQRQAAGYEIERLKSTWRSRHPNYRRK